MSSTLNTYATIGYNIDREMNAACVVKAAYCLYVFQQIENGNGSLNEKLTFEARTIIRGPARSKILPSAQRLHCRRFYTVPFTSATTAAIICLSTASDGTAITAGSIRSA